MRAWWGGNVIFCMRALVGVVMLYLYEGLGGGGNVIFVCGPWWGW